MKFGLLSLLLLPTNTHAVYEDFTNDNSTLDNAQYIDDLTTTSGIHILGARRTIPVFGGTIDANSDADFYSFNAATSQQISIKILSSIASTDPYQGFFNAAGSSLPLNNTGGTGFGSFLSYNIVDTGSYVLAITGFGDSDFTGADDQTNFFIQ